MIIIVSCIIYGLALPYLISAESTIAVIAGFGLGISWTLWLIKEAYFSIQDFNKFNDF
jgi:hypothetical protein